MNIYQVTTRPRHFRHIFFIDERYPYDELLKLIFRNQGHWGGRYDLIVPVSENQISPGFLQIIRHYDPDFVFYSEGVDTEMLKELGIFNPAGYYDLDARPPQKEIAGVNSFYLLSGQDSNAKVLLPQGIWQQDNVLPDFYNLNFGLSTVPYVHEYEMSKKYRQVIIDAEKFKELNKIIHLEKPVNVARLSGVKLNTRVLRNLQYAQYDDFELVVAKDKSAITDLLYYWNRGLYEHKNLMYVTVGQLEELCKDKFFGGVLHDQKGDHSVQVVSTTLSKAEIETLITEKLAPIGFNTHFIYRDISHFPYEVLDGGGLYERNYGEEVTTQTLVSEKGLIYVPKLSFAPNSTYSSQAYVVDLTIKQDEEYRQNNLLFPLTTETGYIIKEMKGRINRSRNISVFINSQQNTSDVLKIDIPSFGSLARQLICSPVKHGERLESTIIAIGPHDAGNRLNAFIQAFKGNLDTIYDFFSDKFWVDLFEYLCTNEKVAGEALTFTELSERAVSMYQEQGLEYIIEGRGWFNLENLAPGLKRTLRELCDYQVFFKGFKLKCPRCSSEFWYHINEVRDTVNCRGCLRDFNLPVEPQFAYKLNDLIRNNIYQTRKSRDGNLTVIRSLSVLQRSSRGSFQYSPQLNLYNDAHSNKPCGDLDIVCTENGRLIIGEAKYNSAAFFDEQSKALKSLAEAAMQIYPDRLILACSVDEKGKLAKSKQWLVHFFNKWPHEPEIETLVLSAPDYWHIKSHRYFGY